MAYRCDDCGHLEDGARVVFTTEATDERGIDVVVAKRWVTCPGCADAILTRLGQPSPWSDEDFKTMVMPGDDDALVGGWAAGQPR